MITRRRRPAAPVQIKFNNSRGWPKGVFSRLDVEQTPPDGLQTTENVLLNQQGTIGPRPGLKTYGTQPTGTVIGKPFEFVRMNTTVTPNVPETYMIWMENRAGVGYVIVSKNGGSHTVATGATYLTTGNPHFEQIYGKVLITTGVDNLSYMDAQTFVITTFTAISSPTTVSATAQSGLTSSPAPFITLRYRVTATSTVGETAASSSQTVSVNKMRDSWSPTTEYVTFVWNRVTGAQRYNIYVGDASGAEYFLDSVADAGSGTTQSYVDNGSITETATRVAPSGDSTGAPKATRATNIKGQVFLVGDTDNPSRIWFGGDVAGSQLDFSSFGGGGWVEPNKGGKDFPVIVKPFRDGKGTPMAVCFTKGTNGAGKRLLLQPTTTTLGDTVITYMAVQEDNGQDGTDSPDAVVMVNDAAWYPSRNGFKVTNTKANIQNILSTNGISDNIAPDVMALSSLYMDKAVGLAHDQRIYWALPYLSTTNNQLWVLDLRQKGAWVRPLHVNCDALWLYSDNSDGKTKMLGLVNNKFMEFDPGTATNDNGTAFATNISSGAIRFDDLGLEDASVISVTFVFLRPQGDINCSVTVDTEDGLVTREGTLSGTGSQSVSAVGAYGWSEAGWGNLIPYSEPYAIASSKARRTKTIEIDEECRSLTWGVSTTDSGVSYQLAEVIIQFVPIGYVEREED